MRICALLLFLALLPSALATTYYVRKDGNNSNTGLTDDAAGAWLTVQKGVTTALSGDTVMVGAGAYSENVTSARAGTGGNRITIDGRNVASMWSFLTTHSNLTVQNCTFAGKASAWWFWMGKGAHYTILSNNIFDGGLNTSASIILRWDNPVPVTEAPFGGNVASWCLVVSNEFKRVSGTTVIQSYGDFNTFVGNHLHDCDAVDWFHPFGRTNYVIANVCSNDYISGLSLNHPDFVQLFGDDAIGYRGIIVESNVVMKMDEDAQICMLEGHDSPDADDVTFRNNLFIGVAAKGTAASPNAKFYNNTFINCSTNPITAGAVLIFTSAEWNGSIESPPGSFTNYMASTGVGGRCYNNIFFNCGGTNSTGGTNTDRGWYVFSADLTNISADYNFVSKNGYRAVDIDGAHRRVGDAAWNKYAFWEDHGINGGNPWFIDETRTNYLLQPISPLINAGTNLSALFTTDGRGVARGSVFDIGAFEYLNPLLYLTTNGIPCEVETRTLQGIALSYPNSISLVWPTNQYRNAMNIYRRTYTNHPVNWPAWTAVYTNTSNPTFATVWTDTNVTSGVHYEYELISGSTNSMCGTNGIDFGYKAFQYLNAGVAVPLRDQRGNVILLCESGVTNALATELTTLVSDLRGDGYKVFRHDIAAVDVSTNGSPGTWYTAVTNTKATVVADYATDATADWTLFIVGHVPIPYSGDVSSGFHGDNVGANPCDWFYAITNSGFWTDTTVTDSSASWIEKFNIPGDGKFDQSNVPTNAQMRLGRIDLRNMPLFPLTEVQLLSQYLTRDHQWRHKQFTVRDRAIVETNSSVTVTPYEVYGSYSSAFGNATNYDVAHWLSTATNAASSYLFASSHGNASYTNDLLLGNTTNFAYGGLLYSAFNSMYGSYYGDWDSGMHPNDVMMAPLCTTGYTLGLYYREQQVNINVSDMGEPYSDNLWNLHASWYAATAAQYLQTGYWYTNGSTFLNPQRLVNYTEYFGDPTLRVKQVAPPTNLVVTVSGSDNVLTWTASTEPVLAGYHIYRAPSSDLNSYTRLTTTPTTSPYTNSGAASSDYSYLVRAIKLEQTDARSYYNASQGATITAAAPPPEAPPVRILRAGKIYVGH